MQPAIRISGNSHHGFRVLTAGYGILSQLAATGRFRAEAERWIPGFAPDPA
ncbi:hypothetical protein [Nonomuraea recticatena]|uniref:Uncharacterized protein n=1 Tax=Nonomuraea recticatena TaxID=46178 RepID=A0ABN3S4A4_9ACTN